MNSMKQVLLFYHLLVLLIISVDGLYNNLVKEDFNKLNGDRDCVQRLYTYFQKKLYEACLYNNVVQNDEKKETKTYNIYLRTSENYGKNWDTEVKLLDNDTSNEILNIFLFTNKNTLIILFTELLSDKTIKYYVINLTNGHPYTVVDSKISHSVFSNSYLHSYTFKSIAISGGHYSLLCGLHKQSSENSPLISCVGFTGEVDRWKKPFSFYFDFYRKKREYIEAYPEFSENDIKFRIVYKDKRSGALHMNYIKCYYLNMKYYNCYEPENYPYEKILPKSATVDKYVTNIDGHKFYVEAITEDQKTHPKTKKQYCRILYSKYSVFTVTHQEENSLNEEMGCTNPIIVPLENYLFLFIYQANINIYGYLFRYFRETIHCATKIGKDDIVFKYDNHNFSYNYYDRKKVCTVSYEDLIKEGEYRLLILMFNKNMTEELKNCFYAAYDSYLGEVPLFQKMEYRDEGEFEKYHIFYMNEHFYEKVFWKISTSCQIDNMHNIKIIINVSKFFVVDNYYDEKNFYTYVDFYPDTVIHYDLSGASYYPALLQMKYDPQQNENFTSLQENISGRMKKQNRKQISFYQYASVAVKKNTRTEEYSIFMQPTFPSDLNYIMLSSTEMILKTPSYISKNYETRLKYRYDRYVSPKPMQVRFHRGGHAHKIFGYDASNTHTLYTTKKIRTMQQNDVSITVNIIEDKPITLGLVCSINGTFQTECFTSAYETNNLKKMNLMRDIMNDSDGYIILPPKTYLLANRKKHVYVETNMILFPEYIKQFKKNGEKKQFTCKCPDPEITKKITFILTPDTQ